MPAPLVVQNWGAVLEPILRNVFFEQFVATVKDPIAPKLFNVVSSAKNTEHLFGVGGFGDVPVYNGRIDYDSFDPNYLTNVPHFEYVLGTAIERKLYADDLYNVISGQVGKMGISFARTREKNGAALFLNAFSSTDQTGLYPAGKTTLGADGITLCGAHPLSPSNPTTQSNSGVLPLSIDNLVTTRKIMRTFKDDRGQLMPVMPDTLLVGPNMEDVAFAIMNSINKPGTANNDINYPRVAGLVKDVLVWDYLAGVGTGNQWFYIDSAMMKQHLWWFQREPLDFMLDPLSGYDLVSRYRGYERYSTAWDWPFWVYGHNI